MTRIIIVDGDAACRSMVREALVAGLSAAVTECADGRSALEALTRESYALLVTELLLPTMSGIQMLALVRQQPRARALPVIVLTDTRDDRLVRRVISLGVGDFLIKPVNAGRLCARARALASGLRVDSPDEHGEVRATSATLQPPGSGRVPLPPLPSLKR